MSNSEALTGKKPSVKTQYRVTNWREYDRALVERGSLTVWLDDEAILKHWCPEANGKRGAPFQYSDIAIQALLTMKAVFHLPYRALEGFARSLMQIMDLPLSIPDHTQMSRRARTLQVTIPRRTNGDPVHVVIDSTGVKIFGEGEWKVRQHGAGKRRTWRKIHFAVDANLRDIIAVEVTTADVADCEVFEGLLEQIEGPIAQIDCDGAYDTREVYAAGLAREAEVVVPPRDNAVAWEADHPRTQALADIAERGMAEWKKSTDYHQRSLAENAMYRFKQLFGDRLNSREFERQVREVHVRVAAMNTMTALGMPVSVRVGVTAP
jgi:hypothetical protein